MTEASTQNQKQQGSTLEMILRTVERGGQDGQCGPGGDDPDFCLRRFLTMQSRALPSRRRVQDRPLRRW